MSDSKFTKGDKTNYIIEAKFVKQTAKSYYLDCEGDIIWFAKSVVHYDHENQKLELPEWLYNCKFK